MTIAEVEAMTAQRMIYWHGRAFRHFESKQSAITDYVASQRLIGGR